MFKKTTQNLVKPLLRIFQSQIKKKIAIYSILSMQTLSRDLNFCGESKIHRNKQNKVMVGIASSLVKITSLGDNVILDG